MAATYAARLESFLTRAAAPYSGLRQDAEAVGNWQPTSRLALGLGYRLERDGARDPAFSYLEHGPTAVLRLGLGGPARLVAETRLTWRGYGITDPDLDVRRRDTLIDGIVVGDFDVADNWTLRATVIGRRALSNVPDFQYLKLTAGLAIVYTVGVL